MIVHLCDICEKRVSPGTSVCQTCVNEGRARLRAVIAQGEKLLNLPPKLLLEYGKRYVYRGLPQPTSPLVHSQRSYGFPFMDPNTGNVFTEHGSYHIDSRHMITKSMFDLVSEYHGPSITREAIEKIRAKKPTKSKRTALEAAKQKEAEFWGSPLPEATAAPAPETAPEPVEEVVVEPKPVKLCEQCDIRPPVHGERFCTQCRTKVLKKIRFIPIPKQQFRGYEKRENTFDTKYGTDR